MLMDSAGEARGYTFAKQGILALLVMHRDAQVPIDGVANRRCCGTNTVHVLLQGGCTRVPVMGKWLVLTKLGSATISALE